MQQNAEGQRRGMHVRCGPNDSSCHGRGAAELKLAREVIGQQAWSTSTGQLQSSR